jgi:hypothetical protein
LAAAVGAPHRLSRAALAALERAADGTAYPARPFPFAELPATAAEAEALAAFIEAGSLATWRGDGRLDVSAPFAACVLADPALFVGPAAQSLAWWLRRTGGFAVGDGAARREGRQVSEPSPN